MKKKVDKKSDIEKLIKEKSFVKEHPESSGFKRHYVIITAISWSSAYYSNLATHATYCFRHLYNTLIMTDTVDDWEGNPDFI